MKYLQGVGGYTDALDFYNVAELLGLSPNYVNCHHKSLGIPSVIVAGKTIFLESEVIQWKRDKMAAARAKLDAEEERMNKVIWGTRSAA